MFPLMMETGLTAPYQGVFPKEEIDAQLDLTPHS